MGLYDIYKAQLLSGSKGGGSSSGGSSEDSATLKALIEGTLTEITSNAEKVGNNVFYKDTTLVTANFPNATSVGEYAFSESKIESIDLPNVISIESRAFYECHNLKTVSAQNVTSIGNGAFYRCSLTSIDFPKITEIGDNVFQYCPLTSIDFPNVTRVGTAAFNNCTSLKEINLPNAQVGQGAFQGCTALTAVKLPATTRLAMGILSGCSQLAIADFPTATQIDDYAFGSNYGLKALILRSDTLCTLGGTSLFTSSPIANGTGYIYVPAALIEDYKAATNWSNYAAQFRALEDYTVDGTTTGELDESKIGG